VAASSLRTAGCFDMVCAPVLGLSAVCLVGVGEQRHLKGYAGRRGAEKRLLTRAQDGFMFLWV
jgi:hypothetical protein